MEEKIYGMTLHSTVDISHENQMSKVIRYVSTEIIHLVRLQNFP